MRKNEKQRSGPGFFSLGVLFTSIALVGYLIQGEFKAAMIGFLVLGGAMMLFEIFRSRKGLLAFLSNYWLALVISLNGILAVVFVTDFESETGLSGMRLWLALIGIMIALDGAWALLYTLVTNRESRKASPRTAVAGNVAFLFKLGIVLLALVNWFGAHWLPINLGTIDTTETQVYSLGDKTKQILEELGEMPGQLNATYVDFGTTRRAMRGDEPLGDRGLDFLQQYADHSPHFTVKSFNGIIETQELKDHFREIGIVKPDLGTETTVVFTYLPPGEDVPNRKDVTVSSFNFIETTQLQTRKFKGEQVYTSAIQDVIYPRKKVYFVKGHGEFETTGGGVNLSDARDLTRKLALETDVLTIAEKGRIPKDADLLIIAGPRTPLLKEEVEILTGYLDQGGSLVLMVGPQLDLLSPGAQYTPFGLDDYLFKLGIRLRSDMVCVDYDPSVSTTGEISVRRGLTILTGDYSSDPIVRDLSRQGLTVRFQAACPVMIEEQEEKPKGVTVEPLVYVRRNWPDRPDLKSFGAKLFPERDPFQENPATDLLRDRMSIAVSAEQEVQTAGGEKTSRIVVFGDARFATALGLNPNSAFFAPGNSTLFSNAVSWAVKRESLIAIDAKILERESVAVEEKEARLAQVIGVYAVPGFVLLLGIAVWWWRRR